MNSPAIAAILAERIDKLRRAVGIAAGIVDEDGRRVACSGVMAIGDPRPVDSDTIFEIGSVTKVFTAALLRDMADRGEVALDDPVAKHLPDEARVPRQITLERLATHTSGLPHVPSNLTPADIHNPYADYTIRQLWDFTSNYQAPNSTGSVYEYSNLGYALLGCALAHRAGSEYEALVRTRITGPLGMISTAIAITPEVQSRRATGHSLTRHPAPHWEMRAFAPAGGLRSSVQDLLTFLEFQFHRSAFGWMTLHRRDCDIVWHNGMTGGFCSFIGYNPDARRGAVLLSNMSTPEGVDDIGFHLLDPTMPLRRR